MERYGISTDNEKSATRNNNKGDESANHSNNKGDSTPKNNGKHTYITDFLTIKLNDLKSDNHSNIKRGKESIINMDVTFSEEEKQFIEDYYNLSFSDLIHEYIRTYPSVECTQLEYDDTEEIVTLPSDYTEIKRRWYIEEFEMTNGDIIKWSNVRKTRNGEGRRNLLFKNLLIRKRILPSITFCHLLLNAVYEVHYFINNTDADDRITKQQIAQIAVNAYFAKDTMKEYKEKRKYIINGLYCAKHGISKRTLNMQHLNKNEVAEKNNNLEKVKVLYNPNLTDAQNLSILSDKGVNISLRTFKRYKKEMGLSKTYNKRPTSDKKQKDNEVITTAEISAENAKEIPNKSVISDKNTKDNKDITQQIISAERAKEMHPKEVTIKAQETANKSVMSVSNVKGEQIPNKEEISVERAQETANNEDKDYDDLMLIVKALKTENDIKDFDFNAYYDTLKKHDIIKMVASAEGFNAKEKALYLKQRNYVAFIIFLQSKIRSKSNEKDNLLKLLTTNK